MHQKKVNHTQKHIKNTQTVDMVYYRGENAVYKFMEKMFQEVKNCKNTAKNISEKYSKLLKKMRKTSNKQKIATFVAKHIQRKTQYSEITVISQENTEDLHIQIVTSIISD